jgi:hypothetical protein
MYFAVMILIALAVVALVLFLEHRGDPQALEREYDSEPSPTNRSNQK